MSNVLRAVVMGTPDFAVPTVAALDDAVFVDVGLVITRPDAVSGRGNRSLPSPVKTIACQRGIPVYETTTLRTDEVQQILMDEGPDVICVAAFGALLPEAVITLPRLGCLNVHASLLPHGRGAAPIQRALLAGDKVVGFSIMRIEEGLDSGPYCAQGTLEPGERIFDEVATELAARGADALIDVLKTCADGGEPVWTEQDESQATFAPKLEKSEVLLTPDVSAFVDRCRVQAASDAAPARCVIAGRPGRVVRAHVADDAELASWCHAVAVPHKGEVTVVHGHVLLGCAEGVLEALEIKPDGKRCMSGADFAAGLRGTHFRWEAL